MEGIVERFLQEKGYGFIRSNDGRKLFVHHTNVYVKRRQTLFEGQKVRFEISSNGQGPTAINVFAINERGQILTATNGASFGKIIPLRWWRDVKIDYRFIRDRYNQTVYVSKNELSKAGITGYLNGLLVGFDTIWSPKGLSAINLWLI